MCKGPLVKRTDLESSVTFQIVAPSFTGCSSLGKFLYLFDLGCPSVREEITAPVVKDC